MVLGSQSPREGMSRQFMSSVGRRRRRARTVRWGGVAALIAAVAIGLYVGLPGLSTEPTAARGEEQADTSSPQVAQKPEDAAGGSTGVSSVPADAQAGSATGPSEGRSGRPAQRNDASRQARRSSQSPASGGGGGAEPVRMDIAGDPPTDASGGDNAGSDSQESTSNPSPRDTSAAEQAASLRDLAKRRQGSSDSGELARGLELIGDGRLIEGRRRLSQVLFNRGDALPAGERETIRETLTRVNEKLIFSDKAHPDDPLTRTYRVKSGQTLGRIAAKFAVPYQVLASINGIEDPRRLRAGQAIKVIEGPFHARIIKQQFMLDLFLQSPKGAPIYVRSFSVGLGEQNSTPLGNWIVKSENGKLKNPGWTNPKTHETYAPDDPDNPIGDYWIALKGIGPNTRDKTGYGIHGTIEPDSIGRQMSMGCIRLHRDDIEKLFHMLARGESTVQIIQ